MDLDDETCDGASCAGAPSLFDASAAAAAGRDTGSAGASGRGTGGAGASGGAAGEAPGGAGGTPPGGAAGTSSAGVGGVLSQGGGGASGGTAGASGGAGGAFGGAGGAQGGAGGGVNCAVIGCGAPPICGEPCDAPCGCCPCGDGVTQTIGGAEYVCQGGCWVRSPDGGAADAGLSCSTNADCSAGTWCRETQLGDSECVPFQQEGEYCGGFTPIWAVLRCTPGLLCADVPPYLADAPGRCRLPCKSSADCGAGQYCAVSGVCRDGGACFEPLDCDVTDNGYIRPGCKGYGECDAGQCGWSCGDPGCREIGSVAFGPCAAVLGVGIVGGACATVSGCDPGGYTLFATAPECEAACVKAGGAP